MDLVIVESPAKSKTIEKYLGKNYKVVSSIGHIRDLATTGKYGLGIDIDNGFKPNYVAIKGKNKVISELKKLVKEADHIYLATDPDREGEAISWHLYDTLGIKDNKYDRVLFYEITKDKVLEGIKNPRKIDYNLVKSQETRRFLDRIIGFRLSKLMQSKTSGTSAGRVQSVALKLIVDREREIQAFVSEEYYTITAKFKDFDSDLFKYQDKDIEIKSLDEVNAILEKLSQEFKVVSIDSKNKNRASKFPFTTSTLQQEASNKLNFNAKKTMSIAQKMYEGIDIGTETVGLITYMRTDSIRLSDEFVKSAKSYIIEKYGEKYYKGVKKLQKGKNIQDAHEAIRPTDIRRTPESIKKSLTLEEFKIYSLIYNRAIASLMSDAILEDTKVDIVNAGYLFNLTGEVTIFDGFNVIYEEANIADEEEDVTKLPDLSLNEKLNFVEIAKEQKFTSPPYRYTEARLIRKMEELGIGRPSTYALTMETLKARAYVNVEKRTFVPTTQGILTTEQLELFFSSIINVKYTAEMETILDKIAEGKAVWYEELRKFYDVFAPLIENARDNMVKLYPKLTDEFCPECGLPLLIRRGPFGEFTACSGYPRCKYIKKTPKKEPTKIGVVCPICGEGEVVERISGKGRSKGALFYACSRFPSCKATFSGIPTGERCPICNAPMIMVDNQIRCNNEHCKSNEGLLKASNT